MSSKSAQTVSKGLTLLELMLALLITSIVMAAFLLFSKSFSFTSEEFKKDMVSQLTVRSFVDQLQFHASQAGFSPMDSQLAKSITAETREPLWFSAADSQNHVSALQMTYDASTSRRDYALYQVLPLTRADRAEQAVYLTRSYYTTGTNPLLTQQLVLAGVKEFICVPTTISGWVRSLACTLEVYKALSPNQDTVRYAFTIGTAQYF